jgi:flagellar basal-body rod protein FlgC
MNLFGLMDTSGGAMQAERMRAEVVAANMANAETTRTASGGPYRRQEVVFAANRGDPGFLDSLNSASLSASGAASAGVPGSGLLGQLAQAALPTLSLPGMGTAAPGVHIAQVVEDSSPPLKRYDPGHPDAGPDGYVSYPDINPLTEMVDLMGATRAYGLNSSAVQAEKGMITSALEIAKS